MQYTSLDKTYAENVRLVCDHISAGQ